MIDGRDATRAAGGDDGTFDISGRNGEPIDAYKVKMAELNAQVDVEGMPAERVAQTYLEDIGIL